MLNQLYINGVLADLSGDALIAITYQVNNLAELKDRQSTYSNSIKLPMTSNNKNIWGQAQADAFTQQQPYQLLDCKLIQNGIEVILNGVIKLLSVSDTFECQITYGLTGLADALKKKTYDVQGYVTNIEDAKLVDLDWSDIPSFSWDTPTIVASQAYEGVLWPVVDYGDTLTNTSTINATYLRPAIYYTQIFERIERFTGYSFSGGASYAAGFTDIIPFSANVLNDYLGTPTFYEGVPVGVSTNLPDITLKDLLKDYMQRYFLTPIVDNYKKTVVFRSFDEVYENKANAKDWTGKFVNGGRSDTFSIGDYAQLNRMLFTKDSQSDNSYLSDDGRFYIANETLDSDKDLVTSIFAASKNIEKLGNIQVASIRKFAETPLPNFGTPFEIETETRVLHIGNAVFGTFNFEGLTDNQNASFIQVGRFRTYADYINNWGTGFLRLLDRARMITRYAVLTELDVKDFDFFTPVYDANDGQYYYVNQILNFIPGKQTQLSLIRM